MTRTETNRLRKRIKAALKAKDIGLAHVLLHSLGCFYSHTPYPARKERLLKISEEFPEVKVLAAACLKGCSQTGRRIDED